MTLHRNGNLAGRIRLAREAKGISQERMAEKIGTSRRHYIRIENGQHRPGRVLLAAIVRETGAEDLAGDEDDEEAASLREDYLVFADLMDRINARREQKEMTA